MKLPYVESIVTYPMKFSPHPITSYPKLHFSPEHT